MSRLLLDSSVWLAARDDDDPFHRAAVELVRSAAARRAVAALDLTLYEVANVATTRWKAPIEGERITRLIVTAAGESLVRIGGDLVEQAIALAHAERLTVYDAAYVACARARGWELVSTDLADLVRPGFARTPEL